MARMIHVLLCYAVQGIFEYYTLFFVSNTFFTSNARLRLAKNQPSVKQYPEAELLLFESY